MLAVILLVIAGSYFALQNSGVQTFLTKKIASQISKITNTEIRIGKVNIGFFNKIILKDFLIEDRQSDTLFYTQNLSAKIDTLKIRRKKVAFKLIEFEQARVNIVRDSINHFNFSSLFEAFTVKNDSSQNWKLYCKNFKLNEAHFSYKDSYQNKITNLSLSNILIDISNIAFSPDSVVLKLNNLSLNDGKQLYLNSLYADAKFTKESIELRNFNFKTNKTTLDDTKLVLKNLFDKNAPIELDIQISKSELNFFELAQLVPAIKGMNQNIGLSGRIYGDFNDLKGKNLILKTGINTLAVFDFYLNDLEDVKDMYLFFDLKKSETTFNELSQIRLPDVLPVSFLKFPDSFYEAGKISFTGNFSGFLTDFVTYGTFSSQMGVLKTDISVIPDINRIIKYNGKVSTSNFELGQLFKNKNFGALTFNGSVDGTFNENDKSVFGNFIGYINEFEINKYKYKNILLDGILNNKMFDGLLSIDDPNIKFSFSGSVNLNPKVPVFDFDIDLQKALPGNLNLSTQFPFSEIAFKMGANFTGNKIDNLKGNIIVEDGSYKNRNGVLNLKGLELISEPTDSINKITFNSDFFDFDILGDYHFQTLFNSLKKTANFFLPALRFDNDELLNKNIFDFHLNAKNLDDLTSILASDFKFETPFLLYGKIHSERNSIELNGSIPGIYSDNIHIKNIFLGNKPKENSYTSKIRIGEILLKNDLALYNLALDTKIADNTIDNQITWTNYHNLTYSGTIKTKTTLTANDSTNYPSFKIDGEPSIIYIADSLWHVDAFTSSIDSNSIHVNNFKFYKNNEIISIDGKISDDSTNILAFNFKNIDLTELGNYLQAETGITGKLNGTAGVMDFYNRRIISSDLKINDFNFKDKNIGNVSLLNEWDNQNSVLNTELIISKNNRNSLYASGFLNPSTKELNYNVDIDHLSLVILETIMRKNFSNFHGDGTGKAKIYGTPEKIYIDGAVEGSNAGLTIDYTQVSYHFTDSIYFKGDTIDFGNISFNDTKNNKGTFSGTIVHDNFQNMRYNLNVRSPKIMALNTTIRNNELFFGQVIANGSLDITGRAKKINLSGTGTTLAGTNVNISLEYENEIEQYDFIQFVTNENSEKKEFLFPEKNTDDFSMDLTVRATSDAKAQLIYNSQIGDVIKAQGEGILKFGMNNEGDITLAGNYLVEKGDYLFTLQNVINKRFTIENGGSLIWSGDPYKAIIDINAVYKLKASLYDLLINSYENLSQNQRIPVECKIKLADNLMNPTIDFEIDFPSVEDRIIDELQQYFSTEEEMNKQILSLLVLGKFYTPEYMRGTYEAQNPNLIGTTASELFSNQLSNWLSQINNNVDIGLNYRPGNQITNDEIELALSTQMFDDRVTLNGNIGNNVNPNSTQNSQIVGDFEINVKLTPNGKIQFKAYNRSNNNLIYETAPYTQGVGFSIKEEYNTLNELLRKLGTLFRKKKK